VHGGPEPRERVRTAELIAALCLGTDLGMGLPFEHGLQTTLVAMRLADALGADRETRVETYYASLLAHAGCTTDSDLMAEVFGGSLLTHLDPVVFGSQREVLLGLMRALPEPERSRPVRVTQIARRAPRVARLQRPHLTATCEVAGMLAEGVGAPPAVPRLLAHLTERWDGKGPLGRAAAEAIPLPMRIVHVALDASLQRLLGGVEYAARLVEERSGRAFDPEIAACVRTDPHVLALDEDESVWERVLELEPGPQLVLDTAAVDRAVTSMASFADLVSPSLTGHSAGVAELAAAAAQACGVAAEGVTAIRRAALLHDLGRVAVHPRIWQKRGPLTAGEWEQVRLHAYHTERVLSRSPFLSTLCGVARSHHERLDGSGYHRGAVGPELGLPERLLAVADAYQAMTSPRPHRPALAAAEAARALAADGAAGRHDPEAVKAVVEAAGQKAPRLERPAGLTEREAEVIALLAGGRQTKEIAAALRISPKTADRHIQNAYRKIGVSTRAAATVFAMERGLVSWGELPIADPSARP